MALLAALFALLASAEPRLPVLCVAEDSAMADDIVDALRVRMEGEQIRVTKCGRDPATWRVDVRPLGDDVLALAIEGGIVWSHELDVHELRGAEASRLVALHVVEAVRRTASAPAESAVVKVEARAETQTTPSPFGIDFQAGAVFGAEPFSTAAHLQVAGKWKRGTTSLLAAVAVRSMAGAERLDVKASGGELHLELAARKQWWRLVELGLHGRGRTTRIAISGSNPHVRNGARTYFDYGAGISGLLWPWRGERFSFGLMLQTTVWARPHWLSVEGQELLRQARVDVFVGPVLELQL